MRSLDDTRARRRPSRESGQATTEFALILFPFLLLVVGIIQFGITLNYWLDMQRIVNQSARLAAVNAWPGCERSDAAGACTNTPPCDDPSLNPITPTTNRSLLNYVECQALTQGLRNSALPTICYPDDGDGANDGEVGSPVRVQLDSPYTFRAIVELGTINLRARAEMRLEQNTDTTLPNGHGSGWAPC